VTGLAWFHCFSGVAGDMALGALVDAGADLDEIRALCDRLPIAGWELEARSVLRCGIGATKVHVRSEETSVIRTAAHITALVDEARLPDRVRTRAHAAFDVLARAEGRLHRRPPESVHFHEVGGLDAIIDIVGTCAALEILGIDEVWCSPIANGIGVVRAAHGILPNPPPAVVEILRHAPTYGLDLNLELTTPTGAALMASLATGFGALPPMSITATGFGAGSAEIDGRPNAVQVVLGDAAAELAEGQPVILLETNVDDASGETLAHTLNAVLDAGAHDAWITPIVMKKGRPAHTISVLADIALSEQVADVLRRESGSLGVRGRRMERWPASRVLADVEVEGRRIRVKVGAGRVKVEHDDAVLAARHLGRPLREVVSLAEEAWRRKEAGAPPTPAPAGGDHHPSHHHPDDPDIA
jgi:uncharacterized protein (TIGR00299 family) protein